MHVEMKACARILQHTQHPLLLGSLGRTVGQEDCSEEEYLM